MLKTNITFVSGNQANYDLSRSEKSRLFSKLDNIEFVDLSENVIWVPDLEKLDEIVHEIRDENL